ncbi:uncharacterized protein JCM15063_000967 [Sporobolomyces koalae]|uniref:uncharacterized protein n=1 Tax=Sporobolomyces koalae TaxID=500713 RepID=UPI00317E8579
MSLPLVGTAVLYWTLERVHSPIPEPPSSPEPAPFTPKVSSSQLVQPTTTTPDSSPAAPHAVASESSDLEHESDRAQPTPSLLSSRPAPHSPSVTLSPVARRQTRPTTTSPPSTSSSTSSIRPVIAKGSRARTGSVASRRSSISSATTSTTSMSTLNGFHPTSLTSSRPLPPVLNSNGSITGEDDDFDSYFDVQRNTIDDDDGVKAKHFGIGIGRPPLSRTFSSSTAKTSLKAAKIDSDGISHSSSSTGGPKSASSSQRSFSLPSFFRRRTSSSDTSAAKASPEKTKAQGSDAKARLLNSMNTKR